MAGLGVQRYQRKPIPAGAEQLIVAKYEPGQPLEDLAAIARMASSEAEVSEVVFPSGKRVLLAWSMRYPDEHEPEPDYETVEPGEYLAFSVGGYSLYSTDDGDLKHFYDAVPDKTAR